MDALIDLEKSRECMSVTIVGNVHLIKLAGTEDDPYFCGKDVCTILGYVDIKNTLFNHVDADEKKELSKLVGRESNGPLVPNKVVGNLPTTLLGTRGPLNGNQGRAVYINEPGLYRLVMASKAPFAKEFQNMVYSVILPQIRKHGFYMAERRLTESMNVQLALEKKQLASKEAELASKEAELALEKSKRVKAELAAKAKILRTLKYNKASTAVEPQEYIYIATTDLYCTENMFKSTNSPSGVCRSKVPHPLGVGDF
jgi:prophage antirepressor-like protein